MLDKEGKPYYIKDRLFTILKLFGINLTPRDLEEMRERGLKRAIKIEKAKETYNKKYKAFMGTESLIQKKGLDGLLEKYGK